MNSRQLQKATAFQNQVPFTDHNLHDATWKDAEDGTHVFMRCPDCGQMITISRGGNYGGDMVRACKVLPERVDPPTYEQLMLTLTFANGDDNI